MVLPSTFERPSFFKRAITLANMDSESALWQFYNLYMRPSAIHRMILTHRHTKGRWSRDDPAFFILEIASSIILSIFWYIIPATSFSTITLFKSLFSFVVFDFGILGIVLSSIMWFSLNNWGKAPRTTHSTDQDVEWRYCFDVFCNSFVAILVDIDIGFVLVAILRYFSNGWLFRVFIPNTIVLAGIVHFIIIAVPCIMILPFLTKFGVMPFIAPVFLVYIITLVGSVDLWKMWMSFHFK